MIDDWQLDATRRAKVARIDTEVPNAARVADFLNGRRNNFDADRRAARTMIATAPAIAAIVPAVLAFHRRAVRFLALETGIRQFLDVGTGLLAGAAATLDFRKPMAVLLPSPLLFIPSTARAAGILSTLLAALSPGSYLALCQVASDLDPKIGAGADLWNEMSPQHITLRSRAEVAGLTAGLDLIEPGLVPVNEWRPTSAETSPDRSAPVYAVLARKPGHPVPRPTRTTA